MRTNNPVTKLILDKGYSLNEFLSIKDINLRSYRRWVNPDNKRHQELLDEIEWLEEK